MEKFQKKLEHGYQTMEKYIKDLFHLIKIEFNIGQHMVLNALRKFKNFLVQLT